MTWNINGWTENNKLVRSKVIKGENPDICTLLETHLKGADEIKIESYETYSFNRKLSNKRAKRIFGGLCVLVKLTLFNYFSVQIFDKEYDGILALKFKHKYTDYTFVLIAGYLPPDRSPYGRDALGFYNHVSNLIYQTSDCDTVYFTGDLNSRVGVEKDYTTGLDNICQRTVLDNGKNEHGKALLDFLNDTKMCICNGRFKSENDNWTCIKWNGTSVVDYFIVPIESFNFCVDFKVNTARDMVNKYYGNVSERLIPDHSVVLLTVKTLSPEAEGIGAKEAALCDDQNVTNTVTPVGEYDTNHVYYQRYNVSSVSDNFLGTEQGRINLLKLIDDIENVRAQQDEIDSIYEMFCEMYHKEMNEWFQKKNVYPRAKKRLYRCSKPFWNEDLKLLWNVLCEKEKLYLKSRGNQRMVYRQQFRQAQNNFDKLYRKTERAYKRSKILAIDDICTSDPKEFWKTIKRLGPAKKHNIPFEVYDDNNEITTEPRFVLNKWKTEFQNLYTFSPLAGVYDDNFYDECVDDLSDIELNGPVLFNMDHDINVLEVRKVIGKSKQNKAIGIDNLPYELFKNGKSDDILTCLFNKIYNTGLIPCVWNLAIIKPLPKSGMLDPRLPLQYRGISLLSTVYKLFSSVLNNRVLKTAEDNSLYVEEQNGFRPERSCADHLFSLTSVIRNRKNKKLSTFVSFVDLEKAFDRVNRNLLFYKLRSMGFGGKLYNIIKGIYSSPVAAVCVNEYITNNFNTDYGVRQGDPLSPTLFGLFINDLAKDIKNTGLGIKIDDHTCISTLLYADDLAIISDNEDDLQQMISVMQQWCRKWRMNVNVKKTKVVHFRPKGCDKTDFVFKYGTDNIDVVDNYKYLGLILDEYLDYVVTSTTLANSAGRALGSIQNKFNSLKGLGFDTFTKLFNMGVAPVMDYCSGIWGYKEYSKVETVQNRAVRFYLGVHNYAPNHVIRGDIGWVTPNVRHKVEILRMWNRFVSMNNDRLTKQVFLWDKQINKRNWSNDVFHIISDIGQELVFVNNDIVNLTFAKENLFNQYKEQWKVQSINMPKLRTYITYKHEYLPEPYVYNVIDRGHRSVLAQFRCGILPLAIETGRYNDIPLEYRLCDFCNDNVLEDEIHFLLKCNFYSEYRAELMSKIICHMRDFYFMTTEQKLQTLMGQDCVKFTAEYLYKAYYKRKYAMYN